MHFIQTTLATALALAGSGLALPRDNQKDDFSIGMSASVSWGDNDDEPSATISHTKAPSTVSTTTLEPTHVVAATATTVTQTLSALKDEPTAPFDSPHYTMGPIPLVNARLGEFGAQVFALVELPSDPSPTYSPHHGSQAEVDAYVLPVDLTTTIAGHEFRANGTLQLEFLNSQQAADSTHALDTDDQAADTTMLEEQDNNTESFKKLREGKCTDVNGQCHIKIKGVPRNKECEQGTSCSSKGSRCFLSGRTWLVSHVSCT
ncbi:hypothetical protein PG993_009211 [Apiospora rasikravindrae]|uniref:Uncharacterized protein n=1 Tax=Apiospora rasikravindrae TaxID=990691 RepID=A0ABR1SIR0_9PEZI